MKSVVETLPRELRLLFARVVISVSPSLLQSLQNESDPSIAEREEVADILSNEFMKNVEVTGEPSQAGKKIDELLGEFLMHWPISSTR